VAVLDLLEQAGDADLDEFVKIAGGDGEKFNALKDRVVGVASLFEDSLVELQPGEK
jgi:hypothetical protein